MKKKMLAERSKTRGKPSDRYPLFVSWSDEDQVFIGYCPVLFVGGVGHDENRIEGTAQSRALIVITPALDPAAIA
jgi:hypothetical protein